ncbi:MAG: carboxypeptidase regulatory-like domain-containing protein, partial [Thermoanaerobaculia bacterium]
VYNASGTTRGWTRTDAAGAYRLAVPAGSYRIAAWDEALAFVPMFNGGARSFVTAVPIAIPVAVEMRANFTLPRASVVTGTVIDAVTRQPLPGMVVDAWSADGSYVGWAQTTAAGLYRLVLASGSYRIVFSDPAGIYAPAYLADAGSFSTSVALLLAPAETREAIDAALVRAGRIAGRITDAKTGNALAGISVAAWNPDGTARTIVWTDSAGNYVLVVPPGIYRIGAWDESLRYATRFRFDSVSFALGATLTVFAGDQHGGIDLALPPVTPTRRRAVAH